MANAQGEILKIDGWGTIRKVLSRKDIVESIRTYKKSGYSGVKVMRMDLTNINFENVDLENVEFVNCNMDNINFNYSSFEDVSFKNCSLSGASFKEARIYITSFHNVKAVDSNFEYAQVKGCQFTDSNMKYCSFRWATIATTHFKNVDMPNSYINKCWNDTDIFHSTFVSCCMSLCNFSHSSLTYTTFKECTLHKANFDHSAFNDCVVKSVTASNSTFLSAQFSDTFLNKSTFDHSVFKKAMLYVKIQECSFIESDFTGCCKNNDIMPHNSIILLKQSDFRNAKLDKMLIHCDPDNMKINGEFVELEPDKNAIIYWSGENWLIVSDKWSGTMDDLMLMAVDFTAENHVDNPDMVNTVQGLMKMVPIAREIYVDENW